MHRTAMSVLSATFGLCEKGVLSLQPEKHADAYPPVFIIGPPRSGTTLLYQVMVQRFSFGYFSNWMAQFPRSPIIASWMQTIRSRESSPPSDYSSTLGETQGRLGLNEAGPFWYRWFPKGDQIYVPAGATPKRSLRELRREVAGMSRVFDASMLFKNVYNSMRIAPILEAFPEASFLVSLRDPAENARSILNARIKKHGNKDRWLSVPPREVTEIKRHPYWEQVVEQVYHTEKQIARDRQAFGPQRFRDVRYEDFCADVHESLAQVGRFLAERNVKVRVRGDVPPRFEVTARPAEQTADHDRIAAKVRQLWS